MDNEMYRIFFQFGFFCLIIESALKAVFSTRAYIKYVKNGGVGEYISKPMFAMIVSLTLCWQSQFDILSKVLETDISTIGIILTGLACSRGSNGLSDVLRRRKVLKDALSNVEVDTIKNGGINGGDQHPKTENKK